MFRSVPANANFPQLEEEILSFWKEHKIYEQSLERRAGSDKFVFYEGPPTANGMPHPGHCLTRAIKDLFPRYKTMRGYHCERKGGWDTHGLPVEVEVCKDLGIHSKEEIEAYGIEPFIQKCQQSVWRYMQEWERLTERLGFWIHLDEAYVTYHQSYVESVWWSLKNLFDRDLLYQGHKIVWWWAQGGTALSAGEVGQGYREVADPSVYVKFPLLDENGEKTDTSLLVWTTTPWTLPSNQFAAVHPDLTYATVVDEESGEKLILAADLVETVADKAKRELTVESTCQGSTLLGKRYVPPFDYYYKALGQKTGTLDDGSEKHIAWRVVAADFVTIESGSGVVHQAPAFGEVDYEVLVAEQTRFADGDGPELICAVGPDGKFTSEAPDYAGRWVKETDKDISRELRERGVLFHLDQYLHDYPFCWRAEEDPLIQYPRKSWFIRTTQFKDRMLENNSKINWLPEHIKDGRFGNFLEANVDWALSRERYWGTPLPIWVCDKTGKMEAIAQYNELLTKPGVAGAEVWEAAKKQNPELPDDLRVHKPYIDAITYDSPFESGGRMTRVPEVIDCWYDSGAMPFAQWGYPHQGREEFEAQFPADFISEAIDQTRGWFYSQLAISTLLFGEESGARSQESGDKTRIPDPKSQIRFPHPFRNCIVLGLMLGEDGQKMSKSKRNYREPNEIFNKYGCDALRWYFFANQAPWTSIRYSEPAIKDSIPEFLLRLWNVYSFFVIYANIDGFDPTSGVRSQESEFQLASEEFANAKGYRPSSQRGELDRWVLSELNRTIAAVVVRMDAYDNYGACQQINEFVDGLSNWYVRRSRDRFWASDKQSQDKLDAYWTLYECLLTTSKMVAPFVPFLAETLWQNLAGVFGDKALESVHLCDYPTSDSTAIDETLSERMRLLREVASLGRSARMNAKLKVRQPLAKVEVILADSAHQSWLEEHDELLRDELNVKKIDYTKNAETYIDYQVQPNFKRVGPRVGKLMPAVKKALTSADGGELLKQLTANGKVLMQIEGQNIGFDDEDLQVRLQAKEGWTAAQGPTTVVVLSTELTDELIREGHARDINRQIQDRRKQLDCEFTDRIEVGIVTGSDELRKAIEENLAYIQGETLADSIVFEVLEGVEPLECEVAGVTVKIFVRVSN
ncbi:MAG: isoleucine--tRNA ligase [Planctomycetaceae bacterium]|nr:isoleucine--tRNA ligase [Planctomycetales bacterium]MCB9922458.1 isoleucine--tRNA ligase [Planctomycetaceae bacterium]